MADQNKSDLAKVKETIEKSEEAFKGEVIDINYEGYEFKVDTALLDDVDALEMIDSIENQNNMKSIVDFLQYLIGKDGYNQMREYFIAKEGRFRISTLSKIYVAIFEKFDPKG